MWEQRSRREDGGDGGWLCGSIVFRRNGVREKLEQRFGDETECFGARVCRIDPRTYTQDGCWQDPQDFFRRFWRGGSGNMGID